MAGEWRAWVEAQNDLTAEEKAKMLETFNTDKLLATLDKGVMTQSRFNRGMDELRTKQQEAADLIAQTKADWKVANDEFHAMQDTVGATAAQLAAKEAEVTALKTKMDAAAIDPTKIVTPDIFLKTRAEDARNQSFFTADIADIREEHHKLFGTTLTNREIVQQVEATGKDPRAWWEEKYGVEAKRTEIAKAAHEAELATVRADERHKVIGELANPATRVPKASAQPFYTPQGKADGGTEKFGPWDEEGEFDAETKLRTELEQAAYSS